jgi:hypothetical protein
MWLLAMGRERQVSHIILSSLDPRLDEYMQNKAGKKNITTE